MLYKPGYSFQEDLQALYLQLGGLSIPSRLNLNIQPSDLEFSTFLRICKLALTTSCLSHRKRHMKACNWYVSVSFWAWNRSDAPSRYTISSARLRMLPIWVVASSSLAGKYLDCTEGPFSTWSKCIVVALSSFSTSLMTVFKYSTIALVRLRFYKYV